MDQGSSDSEGYQSSSRKRSRSRNEDSLEDSDDVNAVTPSKSVKKRVNGKLFGVRISELDELPEDEERHLDHVQDSATETATAIVTPSKRGRGRPKGSKTKPKEPGTSLTPKKSSVGKKLFSTPTTNRTYPLSNGTPSLIRNADRSARRKSARTLIERTVADNPSSDDEDDLARDIYGLGSSDDDEEDELQNLLAAAPTTAIDDPSTPSKKRGRGRPKGSKTRQLSPVTLQSLPPHELYFSQNRLTHSKTSNNTLSSLPPLTHAEYFALSATLPSNSHAESTSFLHALHARSFNQWVFELSQSFNILLYGYGSKRRLLLDFANYVYSNPPNSDPENHNTVIINGYLPTTSSRDILATLASALPSPPAANSKLGAQPPEMLETVLSLLAATPEFRITILIHSLDSPPLRAPTTQRLLSRLASHSQIYLVASVDTPNFSLLWDSALQMAWNWVSRDATTFVSWGETGVEVDVVAAVGELGIGKRGVGGQGRKGVRFVIGSLPGKGKELFTLVVGEVLAGLEEGSGGSGGGETASGVEYRLVYQKAVEEFICGDEVSFRTLLKEFHDHQIIHSRKDALGTEYLTLPFRKEELEGILGDLME